MILLWQQGRPSHLETYDMKSEAVDDIREPFAPIWLVDGDIVLRMLRADLG